MGDPDYSLVMPFDSDDTEFVRGFQMGVVWGRTEPDQSRAVLVYAANAEMLVRMQERGAEFTVTENGPDWLHVEFPFEMPQSTDWTGIDLD